MSSSSPDHFAPSTESEDSSLQARIRPPQLANIGPVWKRLRWVVLGIGIVVFLVPGPPKFADAVSLPMVLTQSQANGVTVDAPTRMALNRAALIYDSRTDLQGVFGAGENLNAHALVQWALTRPDSSAAQLAPFEERYKTVLQQWSSDAASTAGVGTPTVGAPGLPGA